MGNGLEALPEPQIKFRRIAEGNGSVRMELVSLDEDGDPIVWEYLLYYSYGEARISWFDPALYEGERIVTYVNSLVINWDNLRKAGI